MVLDLIMKEIKKFCKNDDTCILIILTLIGFLLCMFFNRSEGFQLEHASLDELNKAEKDIGDIGGNIGKEIGKDIGKVPQMVGIELKGNRPENGYGPLEEKVNLARRGEQHRSKRLNHNSGLDISQVGLPIAYDWGKAGGMYSSLDSTKSDLGMGKPLTGDIVKSIPTGSSQDATAPVTQSSDKKLSLVLFYAPWCGHSKNMLGDYDSVIENYNGKQMNGYTLDIQKINMDDNPEAAKEYDVEIKGFPTLHTFTTVNGKRVSQVFNFRKKDEIVEELNRRTSA